VTWDDELLDGLRRQDDPEGDAVVRAHAASGEDGGPPPVELIRAIARTGRMAPAGSPVGALAAWDAARPPLPDWADPAVIRKGEQFFEESGPAILASLLLASLPEAYAGAKGVQVLHLTARLATDTRRRLMETLQMVVDVMTPGGLLPGAAGYRDARRVRLMHAAVRHLIRTDPRVPATCDPTVAPRWCADWGVPVNQEDLLGTLMTFTVTVFEALARMGITVEDDAAEAYLHAWSVVGHLLGIREDLLPIDRAGAEALAAAIRRRQYAPSIEGREMMAALSTVAAAEMRPRLLAGLPATTCRYLVGERVADLVAVPPADWTAVVFAPARRMLARLSREEDHDRLLRAVTGVVNRSLLVGFLAAERGGDRPDFALPQHLADRWGVNPEAVRARRRQRRPPLLDLTRPARRSPAPGPPQDPSARRTGTAGAGATGTG
jgi:hypothetical protein